MTATPTRRRREAELGLTCSRSAVRPTAVMVSPRIATAPSAKIRLHVAKMKMGGRTHNFHAPLYMLYRDSLRKYIQGGAYK
jgi:hypothetical protein